MTTTPVFQKTKNAAVILCAGCGSRTGLGYNKVLHYAGTKTIIETTVDKFDGIVSDIVCVCSAADISELKTLLGNRSDITFCIGGKTRTQSVRNALSIISADTDIVVIHDGARPFISPDVIQKSIASASDFGSGIVAVRSIDAVKVARDNIVVQSLDKNVLFNMQTPQAFRYRDILDAYNKVSGDYGDDCEVYQLAGYLPRLVDGEYSNIKITTAEDLLKIPTQGIAIGVGFDVHPLTEGRKLILGGVDIPFDKGLLGHSDADVLIHAIMDALLSAAGLPDIGILFPNTDESFKNASSSILLGRVMEKVISNGYGVRNISAVIMCERPKLAAHIPYMRKNISETCKINISQINISATTTEGLGIVGEGKGITASCSCLLDKIPLNSK